MYLHGYELIDLYFELWIITQYPAMYWVAHIVPALATGSALGSGPFATLHSPPNPHPVLLFGALLNLPPQDTPSSHFPCLSPRIRHGCKEINIF